MEEELDPLNKFHLSLQYLNDYFVLSILLPNIYNLFFNKYKQAKSKCLISRRFSFLLKIEPTLRMSVNFSSK